VLPPKRILWPTDFFDTEHDALAFAGEMARTWKAELLVLHVIGDVAEEVYGEKSTEGKDRAAWALWKFSKEAAEQRLEQIVSETLPGFDRYRPLTAFGDPATLIIEAIREHEIDLVVLSARREKTLLQGMLLGSVAYKLVRTAPCNVMLVK
jgi:nucleotide-binding universal stress UspA family protein